MATKTLATKEPKAGEFSDPFADVEVQPVQVAGETVPTRVAVRVKDDVGNYVVNGIVGRDYQLLPNRKVRDIEEDIMSRAAAANPNLGGWKHLKTLFDGKRFVDYWASTNPITTVRNGTSVDLNIGLMGWNAYTGERKTGFEIFALNPFCTNQYHSRNRFGYFAWRHVPGAGVDIDDALLGISAGAANIIRVAPLIADLKHTPLELPLIIEAKANVKVPQTRWGDVLDQLAKEEPNKFGLYQALTNIASHKLSGLTAIDIGSSITDFFLPLPGEKKGEVYNHTTADQVLRERGVVEQEVA